MANIICINVLSDLQQLPRGVGDDDGPMDKA